MSSHDVGQWVLWRNLPIQHITLETNDQIIMVKSHIRRYLARMLRKDINLGPSLFRYRVTKVGAAAVVIEIRVGKRQGCGGLCMSLTWGRIHKPGCTENKRNHILFLIIHIKVKCVRASTELAVTGKEVHPCLRCWTILYLAKWTRSHPLSALWLKP